MFNYTCYVLPFFRVVIFNPNILFAGDSCNLLHMFKMLLIRYILQ